MEPKEGDLKFWWIPQIPMNAFEMPIETLRDGAILMHAFADYDIFQFENNVKPDYSNIGGVVRYERGDWEDVEDEEMIDAANEAGF